MGATEYSPQTKDVQGLLAEVFRVPFDHVSPDLVFGDLPEWDWLGHMNMLMSLEEQFGVEINTEIIAELTSVSAICAFLEERLSHG